jgi:hypothetical protein
MIRFIPQKYKEDKVYIRIAINNDVSIFKTLSEELRDDYDISYTAISKNGNNLQFASERLRNNKSIVLAAVANHGDAIEFASEELKNDKDILLATVECIKKILKNLGDEDYKIHFDDDDLQGNQDW